MAAPSITRPATAINYGGTITATAPLLRSVLAPASYQLDGCTLPNPSTNNQYGFRVTLPAPVDVSARNWITFTLAFNNGQGNSFDALPNGLSILFIDGSGNWVRYPLFYSADNTGTTFRKWFSLLSLNEGYFTHFGNNTDERQIEYSISIDATPIDSSGTVNWSTLSAYEVHIGRTNRAYTSLLVQVMRMAAIDTPVITGGDVSMPMAESRALALFTSAGTTAQIRTELSTELGRIDAPVSSRLADADYTPPDNTPIISAIDALNDLSAADILSAAASQPLVANVKQVNGIDIDGSGTEADPWGPA